MSLSRYERLAYRLFGPSLQKAARQNYHLKHSLKEAHIFKRPEEYLSFSYLNMVVALIATGVPVAIFALLAIVGLFPLPLTTLVLLAPLPFVSAAIIYLLTFIIPDLRASARARDIDAKLPYALNYIATMSSAGVPPRDVFSGLAAQPVYGEVAKEARLIVRDLEMLGKDVVTALADAIDRTPSQRLQDLLQGAITTLTSGGDLKSYFLSKSEQYVYENRQDQENFLETLGVLTESFIVVVVAAPLFLLVMFSVMASLSANAEANLTFGYLLILLVLPLAQLGFGATILFVTPEV